MYAVGRLGSYITRGVYTVSGTFHPFGGAVDIIVVEQPDGSFKSSPWYVRFGKFQGVLKAREKVVNINVNGVDADFHMYLDQSGQAYFLREVEGDEGESVSSFSGDDTDEQLQKSSKFGSGDQIGESDRKVVARSNAHRSKICSVFGQRPTKEDGYRDEGASSMNSLERAEFAADLLDMKWSTNLDTIHPWKAGDASACYALDTSHGKCDKDILTKNGQSQVGLSLHDAIDTSVYQHILAEEIGSCNVQRDDSVWCGFEIQEFSAEEDGLGISSLGSNTKQIVGNVILDESTLEENLEEISAISRNITGYTLLNTDEEDNAEGIISEVNCPDKKFDVESSSDESNVALIEFDICEESKPYRTQSFINETSENSVVGFNGSKEQSEGSLHLTCGGSGEVPFSSAALDMTTPEDRVTKQAEKTGLDILHSCDNNTQHTNPSPPSICDHDELNLELPWTVSESYTQMVTMDPICGFVEVETSGIDSISGFSNSVQQIQNEINVRDEISRGDLQPLLKSVGDSEQLNSDSDLTKSVSVPLSESSEEDQFLFSDLDDLKHRETEDELNFPVSHKEDHHPSSHSLGIEEMNELVITNDECNSSQDSFSGNNQLDDTVNIGNLKVASSPICIPTLINNADTEVGQLAVSLPNLWSYPENLGAEDVNHPLSHSLDSGSKCLDRQWHSKDGLLLMNSGTDNESQSSLECSNKGDSLHSEDVKSALVNPAVGDPSNAIVTTSGSWIFWPFSFKRSRSRKATQPIATETASSDAGNVSDRNIIANSDKMIVKPKALKKMVRANTPTSEEVASLNLKEGSNVVTFTFFTAMLGRQKVDARIYLWKWNTRIVISDVDGTITRSDVLGQFMPLVGVDWSQTGVAHLFSAIKENGYQLLFLSARAISQAYITRQFLVNLKQDGKALPDGPVVISPDGLFPSLFREVIRRAPHEFKIACLEDIKALFPPDCNPFYAGFGNRDTDEISYLKIGIPKGKIFIINPKGEVVVNRRVDSKSYTSLHDLVHDMFPAMTSSEQEDYNSWNYWRLPPPDLKL